MPTATKPPYQTGVYPQPALEALLCDELLPSLWPDYALSALTIERARFSPGKDLALLCALTLRSGDVDRDQRVLVTFAPDKRLEKAAHRYRKKRKKLGHPHDGLRRSDHGGHMFEVFPTDWRLPTLSQVIAPARTPAALSRRLRRRIEQGGYGSALAPARSGRPRATGVSRAPHHAALER